jgi:hypothetical protein
MLIHMMQAPEHRPADDLAGGGGPPPVDLILTALVGPTPDAVATQLK